MNRESETLMTVAKSNTRLTGRTSTAPFSGFFDRIVPATLGAGNMLRDPVRKMGTCQNLSNQHVACVFPLSGGCVNHGLSSDTPCLPVPFSVRLIRSYLNNLPCFGVCCAARRRMERRGGHQRCGGRSTWLDDRLISVEDTTRTSRPLEAISSTSRLGESI